MPPTVIPITDINDPRLLDYRNIKDQQGSPTFSEPPAPTADQPSQGLFYVEGRVVIHYLVRSQYLTKSVLASPAQLETSAAELALLPASVPLYCLAQDLIEQLAGFDMHRGLMAVAYRRPLPPASDLLKSWASVKSPAHAPVALVLEDLSNLDNMGGLFRNAAALGCAGVILSAKCCDPLYRKALRVAVGTSLAIPWTRCPSIPDLLLSAHALGYASAAMTPRGDFTLTTLSSALRSKPTLVLIGSEGPGLSHAALTACQHTCRIPMASGIDSLSAATSGALALYSFIEHRRSWDCAIPR